MFKGTMTKWPVQKLTQGTTQKLTTSRRNRHLENEGQQVKDLKNII